jgi:20S proteasome alpha/beta subunit
MRRHVESLPDGRLPTRDEAEALLERCMKVLFYRDARSVNKFQIATITADGVEISKARTSKTDWGFAEQLRGCVGITYSYHSLLES